MKPPYTYVYPLKAFDERESPQIQGQRTAIRPAGDTRDGDFKGFGFVLPAIAGGYLLYEGCKGGYLPEEACKAIDIVPGTQMPGSCPDVYKVDGSCYCPVGAETSDGGCSYPDAYKVDAQGAIPIGGSPPAPSPPPYAAIALGALALTTVAVLVFKKR